MATIFSVDFGSSFSATCVVNGGSTVTLAPRGERNPAQIPSVFCCHGNQRFVGTEATLKNSETYQRVEFVKRWYRQKEPFVLDNQAFRVQEIVLEIVRYLVNGVRYSLKEQYQHDEDELMAVITTPVTYGVLWENMLQKALEQCGVSVYAVLKEPEAAAYHCMKTGSAIKEGEKVLVYDLGGGTCDVALLRHTGNIQRPFEVLAQDGEAIGGVDWDNHMKNILAKQIREQVQDSDDAREQRKVEKYLESDKFLREAREIKEILSTDDKHESVITIADEDYEVTVTKQELQTQTEGLLNKTMSLVQRVVAQHEKVDHIFLVGGGSRMPQVEERMKKVFPESNVRRVEPELAVAKGAAEYAVEPSLMMRKAAHSYGIAVRTKNGIQVHNQIFKGDALPMSGEKQWTMRRGIANFSVYEGNETRTEDESNLYTRMENCEYLMQVRYQMDKNGISKQELSLGENGLLQVRVSVDDASGWREKTVNIRR